MDNIKGYCKDYDFGETTIKLHQILIDIFNMEYPLYEEFPEDVRTLLLNIGTGPRGTYLDKFLEYDCPKIMPTEWFKKFLFKFQDISILKLTAQEAQNIDSYFEINGEFYTHRSFRSSNVRGRKNSHANIAIRAIITLIRHGDVRTLDDLAIVRDKDGRSCVYRSGKPVESQRYWFREGYSHNERYILNPDMNLSTIVYDIFERDMIGNRVVKIISSLKENIIGKEFEVMTRTGHTKHIVNKISTFSHDDGFLLKFFKNIKDDLYYTIGDYEDDNGQLFNNEHYDSWNGFVISSYPSKEIFMLDMLSRDRSRDAWKTGKEIKEIVKPLLEVVSEDGERTITKIV